VNGQLSWENATIQAPNRTGLDLRRLVAEELLLTSAVPVVGIVDLGGVRVSVLCDDPATWPSDIRLDGLTYDALITPSQRDQTNIEKSKYVNDERSTSAQILSSKERLAWLDRNEVGY